MQQCLRHRLLDLYLSRAERSEGGADPGGLGVTDRPGIGHENRLGPRSSASPPDTPSSPSPSVRWSRNRLPTAGLRLPLVVDETGPIESPELRVVREDLAKSQDELAHSRADLYESNDRINHLEAALLSNRQTAMAVGILVERHRLTPEQAFDRLRTASQHRNIKLRELAERLVRTGTLDPR